MTSNQDINFDWLSQKLLTKLPQAGDLQTPVKGLSIHRRDHTNTPENCFNKPILALTVQGAKRTLVGNDEFRYGAGNALLAGIDLPNMSYLTQASPEKPYLVISLNLDSHLTSVLAAQLTAAPPPKISKGAAVIKTDIELLQSFERLIDLLDKPDQVQLLAPLLVQEIHLHLLMGPYGGLLKSINTHGTQSHQIYRATQWLREHFEQSLDVEQLAQMTHMAPSTFRKHFKAVTTMTPTDYHKHLRLYEAQRLMLEQGSEATTACYQVGYESITQFNREYKRLFGAPPHQSIQELRKA